MEVVALLRAGRGLKYHLYGLRYWRAGRLASRRAWIEISYLR